MKEKIDTPNANVVGVDALVDPEENNQAITLIALIITIIILLILAGVTINVLIGDNSLFNTAKNAGEEQGKAQLKEELEVEIVSIQARKIANGKELTKEDLRELATIGAEIISIGNPVEGEYKDYFFEIDENYDVKIIGKTQGEKPSIICEIITKGAVAQGDKVEIKVIADIEEGTIEIIEATNGAILKETANNTNTEKTYEVDKNGTYYFKTIASNKRSNVVEVKVDSIKEKPEISIKDLNKEGFTIVVMNDYADDIVTEFKYYVDGVLKSSETTRKGMRCFRIIIWHRL